MRHGCHILNGDNVQSSSIKAFYGGLGKRDGENREKREQMKERGRLGGRSHKVYSCFACFTQNAVTSPIRLHLTDVTQ